MSNQAQTTTEKPNGTALAQGNAQLEERPFMLAGATLKLALILAAEDPEGHTFQYCVEDALVTGIKTIRRQRKNAKEAHNRLEFQKELALNPAIVFDQAAMQGLIKKYNIVTLPAKAAQPTQ